METGDVGSRFPHDPPFPPRFVLTQDYSERNGLVNRRMLCLELRHDKTRGHGFHTRQDRNNKRDEIGVDVRNKPERIN